MGRKAKVYPPGPRKRKVSLNVTNIRKRDGLPSNSKRHPEKEAVMMNLLKIGLDKETACLAAGITSKTLRNWCVKDKELAFKVEQASALARSGDIATIHKASQHDWKAAAWKAARLWPKYYGDKQEVTVATEPTIDTTKLSLKEKMDLHALMLKAQGRLVVEEGSDPEADDE